jgi:hypothetical protein
VYSRGYTCGWSAVIVHHQNRVDFQRDLLNENPIQQGLRPAGPHSTALSNSGLMLIRPAICICVSSNVRTAVGERQLVLIGIHSYRCKLALDSWPWPN